MIKIKRLYIQNFLSVSRPIEINFSNLNNIIFIRGQNGVGKTTIIEAIYFAIFGKISRDVNKKSIINRYESNNCLVFLELEMFDKFYKIIRGISPDVLDFYINNNKIPSSSKIELNLHIINELNINESVFRQFFFISTNYTSIHTLSLSDRRKIINDIFSLNFFDKFIRNTKNLKKEKLDFLYKLEKEISNYNFLLKTLENKVKDLKKEIQILEKHNYEKHPSIIKIDEDLKDLIQKGKKMSNNKICFTCGQKINDKIYNSIRGKLIKKYNELKDLRNKILNKLKNDDYYKLIDEYNKISNEIGNCVCKKDELDFIKNKIENELSVIDKILLYLSDDGIKKSLLIEFLKDIEILINKHLNLFNLSYNIKIDEVLNFILYDSFGNEININCLSKGETIRVIICIIFSFRLFLYKKLGNCLNFMIIDEFFDSGLDDSGIEIMIEYMKENKDEFYIIVTHRNNLDISANYDLIHVFKDKIGTNINI